MTMTYVSDSDLDCFRRHGVPVRYARANAGPKAATCFHCGAAEAPERPFEAAHRIPYRAGCLAGISPAWLNSRDNLVWAHRGACNTACEMPLPERIAR